jgi:hypothetical protein
METKKCSVCGEDKLISEFYSRSSRGNKPYDRCKKCFNEYSSNRWILKKIESIIYKGSKCLDCGISYPNEPYVIFDFHHRDPSHKDVDWSKLKLRSEDKILKELDKCDLLCSNCHRKRHHTKNL